MSLSLLAQLSLFLCLFLCGRVWSQSEARASESGQEQTLSARTELSDTSVNSQSDTLQSSSQSPSELAGAEEAIDAEEDALEETKLPGSAQILIPMDGDVFYEPDVKLVARLLGKAPVSIGVLVDGFPITQPTDISENQGLRILSAEMNGLYPGAHQVTLLMFDEHSRITARIEKSFFIRLPEPIRPERTSAFRQFGRVVLRSEYRGGEAGSQISSYRRLTLDKQATDTTIHALSKQGVLSKNFDGTMQGVYNIVYDRFEANGKVMLRSSENPYRQPAHRFSARAKVRPWASIKVGDVYPQMNDLVLSDQRLRGSESQLNLTIGKTRWASLQIAQGESYRSISAHEIEIDVTQDSVRFDSVPGTYRQNILATRLGFGGGPLFDMGFTLLKASDRISSIDLELNDSLFGPTPSENLVMGYDLRVGFWNGQIQLFTDAAFSMHTRNTRPGALNIDSTDFEGVPNPENYDNLFVLNQSTEGITYFVQNENHDADVMGFIKQNAALKTGVRASFPAGGNASETELSYSHLGLFYHTEGNPYLGASPEHGFTVLQKVRTLQNRLGLGIELGSFRQSLGLQEQVQRHIKGEIRYSPLNTLPGFWIGGGTVKSAPDGGAETVTTTTELASFYSGAYHQIQAGAGKLHGWAQYSFSKSDLSLRAPAFQDTSYSTKTNVITTSLQYKLRNSRLVPRMSYSFTSNGIQQPTNNVTTGFSSTWGKNLTVDAAVDVGQYPESNEKNDVKLGETVNVGYNFSANQSLRFRERYVIYGKRSNVIAGAYYDLFF